jgi:hypothetical protein
MEMLNAENFMRAQVTERIKELHRRERERLSKRSALDTQSSHVVGSKNTSPNTIKEKQHG